MQLHKKIEISNTSGQSFGISVNSTIAPYLGILSEVLWTPTSSVPFAGFPNLARSILHLKRFQTAQI